MIRARRSADLDPLCAVLRSLGHPAAGLSADDLRGWLEEHDAEQSWVYDMAPVHVTPTGNVVGHVQIHSPTEPLAGVLVERTGRPAGELLAIGKLFVRPDRHQHGFARQLLKESVRWIRAQGKVPVLDLRANRLTEELCRSQGFEAVEAHRPGVVPMVHTGARGRR